VTVVALSMACGGMLGCSERGIDDDPTAYSDPVRVEARVRATLDDLAAFGNKRSGGEAVVRAGDYIAQRFRDAGLSDVHGEEFTFPAYDLHSTDLTVRIDGVARTPLAEAFAVSGVGAVSGSLVDVGHGLPADYVGKDVAGKIVLVVRDAAYHRSAQYLQAIEHGAIAMLYVSQAPQNLIQIGTVADPEDGPGPIPSISIGKDDGDLLIAALANGQRVDAEIAVAADTRLAVGRNIVGRLRGSAPGDAYILIGAHYDTWYAGSADNGTGVAAVIEIAEAFARRGGRSIDLVFVAYDGEELGLFGGYDWLRRHVVVGREAMLAWVNFESPAADPLPSFRGLGRTTGSPIGAALEESGASMLYNAYAGMELVPVLFGGIIPTDIQGMYWYGLQGFSTASDARYYHTAEDTPDKVDTAFLADAVLHFEVALDLLDGAAPSEIAVHDPFVWKISPTLAPSASGDLDVDVLVTAADGTPQPDAFVRVWLDVDDFTRVYRAQTTTDASGRARATIPASALAQGSGDRWMHITAGQTYPLAETIVPIEN
jgi:hypothetical protein